MGIVRRPLVTSMLMCAFVLPRAASAQATASFDALASTLLRGDAVLVLEVDGRELETRSSLPRNCEPDGGAYARA